MKNWMNHYLNPLHVYCRLVDVGISKAISRKIVDVYERWLYNYLMSEKGLIMIT